MLFLLSRIVGSNSGMRQTYTNSGDLTWCNWKFQCSEYLPGERLLSESTANHHYHHRQHHTGQQKPPERETHTVSGPKRSNATEPKEGAKSTDWLWLNHSCTRVGAVG